MERVAGIEPASSAWKAEVLPLNYTRGVTFTSGPAPNTEGSHSPFRRYPWWRGVDSNHRSSRVRFTV